MVRLLFSAVIVVVLLQGTKAAYCKKYTNSIYGSSYYTYIYCSDGCCGTTSSRYCCSSYSSYGSYYNSTYWSFGAIIGAVIGGIIGLCVLITIVLLIIKACTKSGSHGRVVQPANPNPNVVAMSTTVSQPGGNPYPPTQYGMAPAPYPGPSGSQLAPPPVYPTPLQPSSLPGAQQKTG